MAFLSSWHSEHVFVWKMLQLQFSRLLNSDGGRGCIWLLESFSTCFLNLRTTERSRSDGRMQDVSLFHMSSVHVCYNHTLDEKDTDNFLLPRTHEQKAMKDKVCFNREWFFMLLLCYSATLKHGHCFSLLEFFLNYSLGIRFSLY